MLPRLSRKWRTAEKLKPGDYVHTTAAGYRVVEVTYARGGVVFETELDSGTTMYVSHPRRRALDVTRTFRGVRRLWPFD